MSKQPAYLRKCECGELFGSDDEAEFQCDFCRRTPENDAVEVENEGYIWDDVASYYPNERFGDLNEELEELAEERYEAFDGMEDGEFSEDDRECGQYGLYSPDFYENTDD